MRIADNNRNNCADAVSKNILQILILQITAFAYACTP
jgi:hypothetical protein